MIPTRRGLLMGGGAIFAGAAQAASQPALDYAVFTELSPDTRPMKPGWNRRVFTNTDVRKGNGIQCDFTTGVVTLVAGAYHITGLSTVTYYTADGPPGTTAIHAPAAAAGYCRLRTFDPNAKVDTSLRGLPNDDPSVISVGSPAPANMVPSLFDAFLETARTTQLVLEHQSGDNPGQIYLRVFAENSKWHAMARIGIRRL